MKLSVDQIVDVLRATGEVSRLRILALLRIGDLSVGELVEVLGQSQPGISQHLKVLTACGLVERMPESSWVFYRATRSAELSPVLEAIFDRLDMASGDFARDRARLERVRAARAESADSYFERVAGDWDTIRALHYPDDAIEHALLEAAGDGPFDRVVDIGTGTGRMLALFSGRARELEGIDRSHEMLTVARANLMAAGAENARVRQADATALPFDDGHADLVIIHQVLHYIDEPAAVFAEAARILKPGGRLLLVDFAPHTLEFLRIEHAHRHLGFSAADVSAWAGAAGLHLADPTRFAPPTGDGEGLSVQIFTADYVGASQEALA